MFKLYLSLVLLVRCAAISTEATEFVFGFLKNDRGRSNLVVYVSNQNDRETSLIVTSSYPALQKLTKTVGPQSSLQIFFPKEMQAQYSYYVNYEGVTQENNGIKIVSRLPISLTTANYNTEFSSISTFLVLPTSLLKTTYYATTTTPFTQFNACQLTAIAATNSSLVTITTVDGSKRSTYLPNLQSVTISSVQDLSGTKIEATAPVAVVAGCLNSDLEFRSSDSEAEMLIPASSFSRVFPLVSFVNNSNGDYLRVVASEANTTVYLDGVEQTVLNNHGGSVFQTFIWPRESHILTASGPVSVGHIGTMGSDRYGDVFMVNTPGLQHFVSGICSFTALLPKATALGPTYQVVTVISEQKKTASIRVDGKLVEHNQWSRIASSEFFFAHVPIESGNHTIESPQKFTATVYGYGYELAYGYVCGYDLPENNLPSSRKTDPVTVPTTTELTFPSTTPFPSTTELSVPSTSELTSRSTSELTFSSTAELTTTSSDFETSKCSQKPTFSCDKETPKGCYTDPANPCERFCYFCVNGETYKEFCEDGYYYDVITKDCLPMCEVPACTHLCSKFGQ